MTTVPVVAPATLQTKVHDPETAHVGHKRSTPLAIVSLAALAYLRRKETSL